MGCQAERISLQYRALPGREEYLGRNAILMGSRTEKKVKSSSEGRVSAFMVAPIDQGIDEKLDWSLKKKIIASQNMNSRQALRHLSKQENPWKFVSVQIRIPDQNKLLRVRTLIAIHTDREAHRAFEPTLASVSEQVRWKKLREDTQQLLSSCFHCIATESGATVSRPLGHTMHANKANDIIHLDYFYMNRGEIDLLYVLIFKGDLSGYVWLKPTSEADAENTAKILLDCLASTGVPKCWISYKGSHFKNQFMKHIAEAPKVNHHFTLPYCLWTNTSVDLVCREWLRTKRAILSELKMPQKC